MNRQVIEHCRSCGSHELEWQRDFGWLTGAWRYLRCKQCGDFIRLHVPGWTLLLYVCAAIAAAASWWWVWG